MSDRRQVNLTGVFAHLYFFAITVVTALTWGTAWALVPLIVGFMFLLGAAS